jgi:hypothetical protein
MDKLHKIIYTVDAILVFGSMIGIFFFVGYATPLVIAPIDNYVTSETSVLFEFEKADKLYIDDNLEFSSPEEIFVEDDLVINMKPGKYYWKVEGVLQSDIRELTVQSEVNLKLDKVDGAEDKYEVTNAGNVKLNVDIYDKGSLIGNTILDIDEISEEKGTRFIGGQNE